MAQFSIDMIRSGRVNGTTGVIGLVAFAAFIGWRVLTLGTADTSRVLGAIEAELVDDFRQRAYAEAESDPNAGFAAMRLADVAVTFENVSMAAPLVSWSINEDVVVRFDYQLTSSGVVEAEGTREYRLVTRKGASNVWDSGPVQYYVKYLF